MAFCPFMSKNASLNDRLPCPSTCALKIGSQCSFAILAQKALHDMKQSESEVGKNLNKTDDTASNF